MKGRSMKLAGQETRKGGRRLSGIRKMRKTKNLKRGFERKKE